MGPGVHPACRLADRPAFPAAHPAMGQPATRLLIPLLFLALLALASCSATNPIAGAAVTGSTHGGWGAPRATPSQADNRTAERPAETASRADEPVADSRPAGEAAPEQPRPRASAERTEPAAPAAQRLDERLRERQAAAANPQPAANSHGPAAASRASAAVSRVSFAERSDGRGLVVRVHSSGPVPAYRVEEIEDGRLQLTLFQTGVQAELRRDDVRGPVRSYDVNHAGDRTIVSLNVDSGVYFERQPYPDRDSDDLLLPLIYAPRPVAAANQSTTAAAGGGTGAPVRTAASGASAADEASREHWRFDCVVIDAGHGGRDPGAVAHGVRESDVNLGIARRLGRLVEENLNVRVVYTRTDDRFVELAERGRIANQSCGKLFVSIHANSASNASAQGTETYFLGMHRSESARRVMERENSVIALESDPSLYSGMDEASLIMQTMAQSTYQRASESLAGLIENQFVNRASRNSRGVKQAGFLVLWRASMPAVLIETGFLTNREEARFLGSSAGQQQIAEAIYRAIREYKQQYERGLGIAAN